MKKSSPSLILLLVLLLAGYVPITSAHLAPFPLGYSSTDLVIDTIAEPESLDPAWAYDTASTEVIANVYETLVSFDTVYTDGPYGAAKVDVFKPKLATDVSIFPGPAPYAKTFCFRIRGISSGHTFVATGTSGAVNLFKDGQIYGGSYFVGDPDYGRPSSAMGPITAATWIPSYDGSVDRAVVPAKAYTGGPGSPIDTTWIEVTLGVPNEGHVIRTFVDVNDNGVLDTGDHIGLARKEDDIAGANIPWWNVRMYYTVTGVLSTSPYTITADDDSVYFHDGVSTLNPRDVEYSFERLLVQDRSGGPAWMLYEPLLGVYGAVDPVTDPLWGQKIGQAIGSNTTHAWVNLMTDFPETTFLQIISQPWSSIVDQNWAVANGNLVNVMGDTGGVDTPIGRIQSTPAIGDIDDDGDLEIVIGTRDSKIYCLNGSNGAIEWNYTTGSFVMASAGLADFDNDRDLEIVVGSLDGNVYFLNGDENGNSIIDPSEVTYFTTSGGIFSSPAIGDVDDDGDLETIIGSQDSNVYSFDYNPLTNSVSLNWVTGTGGAVYSSPALADRTSVDTYDKDWPMFRHNANRTGFYGVAPPTGLDIYVGSNDGYLYLLEGADGFIIDRFLTNGPIHTSPSVADIDGDQRLEILFYDYGANTAVGFDTFWCLEDGPVLGMQWSYAFQPYVWRMLFGSSPAISDLGAEVNSAGGEPDSDLEIVTGSDELTNFYPELGYEARGIWRTFDSSGKIEWAKDTETDEARSSPVIADINGDGYMEIAAGTTSGWNVEVMNRFGDFNWTFPSPPTPYGPYMWHSSPAVADVSSAVPGMEVVIGDNYLGYVWAFDGDNSDGVDEGITYDPTWYPIQPPGTEGVSWDVLWIPKADWKYVWNQWHNPPVSPIATNMMGTGPYQFSLWNPSLEWNITQFPKYWDGWPAYCSPTGTERLPSFIGNVTWNLLPSWPTRRARFLAGAADFTVVPRLYRDQVLGQVVGGEKIRCFYPVEPQLAIDAMLFNFNINTQSPYLGVPGGLPPGTFGINGIPPDIFSDINVRRGFAAAFDYNSFLSAFYLDEADQPADPVIVGLSYDNPVNKKPVFDLSPGTPPGAIGLAEYYLKLAWGGVDNPPLGPPWGAEDVSGALWNNGMTFTVPYNSGNVAREVAVTLLANNVMSLNSLFTLDVQEVAWGSTYLPQMVAGMLPLFSIGWTADYPDPDNFAFPFMHTYGTFSAWQSYSNTRVDELIEYGALLPEDTAAYEGQLDRPDLAALNAAFNNPGGLPPDTRWPRRSTYYELQAIYVDDVLSVPLVQPVGRHWEQAWVRGWYYNPLYGGSLTSGIGSTAPTSPANYFYHLWKAKTHFGDANNDGTVGVLDGATVSASWSKPSPDSLLGPLGYRIQADLTGGTGGTIGSESGLVVGIPDGKVSILDVALVSSYWDGPPQGPSHP